MEEIIGFVAKKSVFSMAKKAMSKTAKPAVKSVFKSPLKTMLKKTQTATIAPAFKSPLKTMVKKSATTKIAPAFKTVQDVKTLVPQVLPLSAKKAFDAAKKAAKKPLFSQPAFKENNSGNFTDFIKQNKNTKMVETVVKNSVNEEQNSEAQQATETTTETTTSNKNLYLIGGAALAAYFIFKKR